MQSPGTPAHVLSRAGLPFLYLRIACKCACAESLPMGAGRGGGAQAESLEPRFLLPELPNKAPIPALPFLHLYS